jgi:hypothetical protein
VAKKVGMFIVKNGLWWNNINGERYDTMVGFIPAEKMPGKPAAHGYEFANPMFFDTQMPGVSNETLTRNSVALDLLLNSIDRKSVV